MHSLRHFYAVWFASLAFFAHPTSDGARATAAAISRVTSQELCVPFLGNKPLGVCCVLGCLLFRPCSSFPSCLPWPGRCRLSVSLSVTWLETWFNSPKFPCKNRPIPLISSFILVYFIFFLLPVLLFPFFVLFQYPTLVKAMQARNRSHL